MPTSTSQQRPKGFTLVDLFIVLACIGVLAAIAIPQYMAYKDRGHNEAARSALEDAVTAQEAYYVDNSIYADKLSDLIADFGLNIPEGVVVSIIKANEEGYEMDAYHKEGNNTYVVTGPGGSIRPRD